MIKDGPAILMTKERDETHGRGVTYLSVLSSEAVEEFKQDRVYTNLHATDSWEMHRNEYGASDQLVKHLTPGKRLVLSLNAMFPGWVNNVRYAKLTVYFV